ncbi:WD40 repeat domain-containing protein [Streptomyces sp. NPDC021020]|uniref:WD40 repeat domain-containing protein n=1 Tax=Streptomyces sp. NPDC021020 TaxID=3365109 RepID=UPI0037B24DD5
MSEGEWDPFRIITVVEDDYAVWPLVAFRDERNRTVVISSFGGGDEIAAWDVRTGQRGWSYDGGEYFCYATSVISSRGGRSILIVGHEDGAERFDARTGEQLSSFPLRETAVWGVDSGILSSGQEIVVAAGYDGSVHRWDPATAESVGSPLEGHAISVKSVALAPISAQGTMIVSGDDAGVIRRWDAVSGEPIGDPIQSFDGPVRQIASVNIASSGTMLITTGSEGEISRWDALTGEKIGDTHRVGAGIAQISTVYVDGICQILSAGSDNCMRRWEAMSGRLLDASTPGYSVTAVDDVDGLLTVASGTIDGKLILCHPGGEVPAR